MACVLLVVLLRRHQVFLPRGVPPRTWRDAATAGWLHLHPRSGVAGAVEATVDGAGATRLLEALTERRAGTVPANLEVVRRDAESRGCLCRRFRAEVDSGQYLGVLRLEGGDERFEALAQHAVRLAV